MQICMKLNTEARRKLTKGIEVRLTEMSATYSEIASATDIHASQVSRICRGQFKTISPSVVQICRFLGVDIFDVPGLGKTNELHQKRLKRGVLEIWDRTPEDADRIVRLLRQIAALRGMS